MKDSTHFYCARLLLGSYKVNVLFGYPKVNLSCSMERVTMFISGYQYVLGIESHDI